MAKEKNNRTYPEGAAVNGVIGRTVAESTPTWPVAQAAPENAPNILWILLSDGDGQR